jgi:hypothetical protein
MTKKELKNRQTWAVAVMILVPPLAPATARTRPCNIWLVEKIRIAAPHSTFFISSCKRRALFTFSY